MCLLGGVPGPGGCLVWGGVCSGGVPGLGVVVSGWGGLPPRGVGIPACTEADTPPPCGQTDACKNITLAQLRCSQ